MAAFRDLVSRARAGTLRSSELSDPTITVTSLGERGVEAVLPIIFPPQVAIVGFGRLVERPWISEGQILACPVVTATLAADHRVTDGHRASAFLAAVDRLLQEPEDAMTDRRDQRHRPARPLRDRTRGRSRRAVSRDVDFRDQLDLDSMDLLNFVIGVDEELGVDIPESDYPRLDTLDGFVAYLAERLGSPAGDTR